MKMYNISKLRHQLGLYYRSEPWQQLRDDKGEMKKKKLMLQERDSQAYGQEDEKTNWQYKIGLV